MIRVRTDPAFDPALKAFYDARVIEMPTPRWTSCDAANFDAVEFGSEVPMTMTERAYTSTIRCTPAG